MKKTAALLLAAVLFLLCAGCSQPDALTLDLFQGYGQHLKLIHLNASSGEKEERMEAFSQVLENARTPGQKLFPVCLLSGLSAGAERQWTNYHGLCGRQRELH